MPVLPNTLTRAHLEDLIRKFVARWKGGSVQRTPEWYKTIGVTIGGSEISAVRNNNPYSSFHDVCIAKYKAAMGIPIAPLNSPACWFGILFEPIIGRCIEIDLATTQLGENICIQSFPGHRYSPDGYAVVGLKRVNCEAVDNDEPQYELHRAESHGDPDFYAIALLEYKCPHRRRPTGTVPKQYQDQPQSGLSVSPIAHFALFIDSLFRKCTIDQLGPGDGYDLAYHFGDERYGRKAAVRPAAWGLVAVYAPKTSAPLAARLVPDEPDADASVAAWEMIAQYFGSALATDEVTSGLSSIDLGALGAKQFDRALDLINKDAFKIEYLDPYFANGLGNQGLKSRADIGRTIRGLHKRCGANNSVIGPDYYFLGVIPWKLFETNYVPIERIPGFIHTVKEIVEEVRAVVAGMVAATRNGAGANNGSVAHEEYLMNYCAARPGKKKSNSSSSSPPVHAIAEDDVNSFFSECASSAPAQ
jgi:hypothetical protein